MIRLFIVVWLLLSFSALASDECEKGLAGVKVYSVEFTVNDLKSFQWAELVVKDAKGHILSVDFETGDILVALTKEAYERVTSYFGQSTIHPYDPKNEDHEALTKWYALELENRARWGKLE